MFGNRLKELREKQGMTQNDLADHLSVSRQSIGGYEKGTTEPPFEIVVKIADKFNVTCDYLLSRTDEKYNFNSLDADFIELLVKLYEDKDVLLKLYENKDMLLKIYDVIESYTVNKK